MTAPRTVGPPPWRLAARRHWPWAFLAVAIIAFHAGLLLGDVLHRGDALPYQWPEKLLIRESLACGRLPWLNPYILCGTPVLENPDAGALNPLNLLLLAGPAWLGMNLFILSHILLAALAMQLFLARGLRVAPAMAAAGATAYALGGYVWSAMDRGGYRCAWLVPLWALAILAVRDAPDWRRAIIRGLPGVAVLALLMLCGNAQEALAAIALGLVAMAIPGPAPQGIRPPLPSAPRLAVMGILILCAALIAAPQWLPALIAAGRSYRSGGIPLHEAQFWSLPPLRWLELAIPFPCGTRWGHGLAYGGIYPASSPFGGDAGCGPWAESLFIGIPLLLGAAVFILSPKDWRGRLLLALLIASALMAMGRFLPLYGLAYRLAPPLRLFRHPERFLFWVHFALTASGALGLHAAWRRRPGARARLAGAAIVLGILLLALLAALAAVALAAPEAYAAWAARSGSAWPAVGLLAWQGGVTALSLAATAGVLLALRRRLRPRTFAVAMLAITLGHLALLASLPMTRRTAPAETVLGQADWTHALPPFDRSQWRIFAGDALRLPAAPPGLPRDLALALAGHAALRHNLPGTRHLRSPQGFSPAMDAEYLRFFDFSRHGPERLLDLAGVRYLAIHPIADEEVPSGSRIHYRAPDGSHVLLENTDALPRAMLLPDGAGPPLPPDVLEDAPGRIRLRIAQAGVLRLADWHLPGWRCHGGNGAELAIASVDGGFMAVQVPPEAVGTIRFAYRAPGWRGGIVAMASGMLLAAGLWAIAAPRHRHHAGVSPAGR